MRNSFRCHTNPFLPDCQKKSVQQKISNRLQTPRASRPRGQRAIESGGTGRLRYEVYLRGHRGGGGEEADCPEKATRVIPSVYYMLCLKRQPREGDLNYRPIIP